MLGVQARRARGRDMSSSGHAPQREASQSSRREASKQVKTSTSGTRRLQSPIMMTTRRVGGTDSDHDRPAKISRRSLSRDDDRSALSRGSSVFTEDRGPNGADIDAASVASESQPSNPNGDTGLPEDADVVDAANQLQIEEAQAELRADLDTASGQSTPWQRVSRSASPVKTLKLILKPDSRTIKPHLSKDELLTERNTPEPEEPGGILKRLPGRRRAPHPDLNVEVGLRRQLELKVAYRAVAKALKPMLAELAERTARQLEADASMLKQYPGYNEVQEELKSTLERRLHTLETRFREEEDRMMRELQAAKDITESAVHHAISDHQDEAMIECQSKMLTLLERERMEQDSDATDYEDDAIVPGRFRVDRAARQRVRIPDEYDSRSRRCLEIEVQWDRALARNVFREEQGAFDQTSLDPKPQAFAVNDACHRDRAIAGLNLIQFAAAAVAVERADEIAAEEKLFTSAGGLHALGDAANIATEPSIPILEHATPKPARTQIAPSASPHSSAHALRTRNDNSISVASPHDEKKTSTRRTTTRNSAAYTGEPSTEMQDVNRGQISINEQRRSAVHEPSVHEEPLGASSRRQSEFSQNNFGPGQQGDVAAPSQHDWHPHHVKVEVSPYQPAAATGAAIGGSKRDSFGARDASAADFASYDREEPSQAKNLNRPAFQNNRGPPLGAAAYIRDSNLLRPQMESGSPITLQSRAPEEWPGFSSNAAANQGMSATFDAKVAQSSAYPHLAAQGVSTVEHSSRSYTSADTPSRMRKPSLDGRHPLVPGDSRRDGYSAQSSPHTLHPTPFLRPPWDYQGSYQANGPPPPLQPFISAQQHATEQDRPPLQVYQNTAPAPQPLLPPAQPHPRVLDHSKTSSSSSYRNIPLSTTSPASRSGASYDDPRHPSRPSSPRPTGSTQVYAPSTLTSTSASHASLSRSQASLYSGQIGHQRILPASLDPTRRNSSELQAGPNNRASAAITPSGPDSTVKGGPRHGLAPRQVYSGTDGDAFTRYSAFPMHGLADARPNAPTFNANAGEPQKERHRPPGQLQWKHYANIQPAPSPSSTSTIDSSQRRVPPRPTGGKGATDTGAGGSVGGTKRGTDDKPGKDKPKSDETRWRHSIMGWSL